MKKNKPIVVAQIMGKWVGGGVEAVIMNYYRHIDKNIVQFDFICDEDSTNIPYEEIESLGGRVIICPRYQSVFKYQKFLIDLFKKNKYKIVHSNINTLSVFPLRAAKKAGVPIRIAHSHSTSNKIEWKKNIIKNVLKLLSKVYANKYICCSELAGRYQFGNKAFDNGEVFILNNAIDINNYKFDKKKRNKIRKKLNIDEDTIVIGHIGRFVKQKNHDFIIDIFNNLKKKNYKLLLIGQGPLEEKIKNRVQELGLLDKVIFAGQKENVNDYYNAMDLFLFPSLYEGLGLVLIEAQVNGLSCIVSSEVPKIAEVSDKIKFLDLNLSSKKWSTNIIKTDIKDRKLDRKRIVDSGFDIENEVSNLVEKYKNYYEEV